MASKDPTKHLPRNYTKPNEPDPIEQAKQQLQHWRRNPIDFAKEVMGLNPSNQQTKLFIELGKLVTAKMKRDEGELLDETDKKYIHKRGISIRSGKGTGKDTAAAIITFWFLFCFHQSKTYLLAPSMDNLKSNLMAEMSLWKSRRVQGEQTCKIADELDLMSLGCRMINDPDKGKSWFVTCNSAGPHLPAEQQVETLQGKHARYMMFIIDEASGVPDAVFQPLDTTLTDPVNFVILLFNPTRRSGFAHNTQFDPNERKYWINLHWSAEDSNLITPDQIKYLKDKYGTDSNQYRVSVLGEPPAMDDGSLIPYEWALDAANLKFTPNDKEPTIMGVDVARQGKDSSVILVRKGNRVIEIQELKKLDTVELSRWIAMRAADHNPQAICIDSCGLGIGVVDELNRQGITNVYPVNVSRGSSDPRKFHNLRDEYWWKLRERFERNSISLSDCPDQELISEISSIKYEVKDNGKIKIESKQEMRARNMPSPNKGDALMLTMSIDDSVYYATEDEDDQSEDKFDKRKRSRLYSNNKRLSWLEV